MYCSRGRAELGEHYSLTVLMKTFAQKPAQGKFLRISAARL